MSNTSPKNLDTKSKKPNQTRKHALTKVEELQSRLNELEFTINQEDFKTDQRLAEKYNEIISSMRSLASKMRTSPANHAKILLDDTKRFIESELPSILENFSPTTRDKKDLTNKYNELSTALTKNAWLIDKVRRPDAVFDPSDPNLVGRMIALVFTSQPAVPLKDIKDNRFYGSGVYALYYKGEYAAYAPLKNKPHPIYVGTADPMVATARTPVEQGVKLHSRLCDHIKSIEAATNLDVNDFEARYLVVAGNWQRAAEIFLIRLMNPIWNRESRIAFGIGKHGDAATTRQNNRSPWDTLHPGRKFAEDTSNDQVDAKSILKRIDEHFKYTKNRVFNDSREIFNEFVREFSQLSEVLSDDLTTAVSEDDKAD